MQWLIDALREPAAQLIQLAGSAAALWLAGRIRGKQKALDARVSDVEAVTKP